MKKTNENNLFNNSFNVQQTKLLIQAIWKGSFSEASEAIKSGADINDKFNNGNTALYMAVSESRTETVELLIKSGFDINAKYPIKDGLRYTNKVSYRGHTEIVKLLIDNKANVNAKYPMMDGLQ